MKINKQIDLILACIGNRNGQVPAENPEEYTESDWADFLDLSMKHRIDSILYKRLEAIESGLNFPGWVIRKLRMSYFYNQLKSSLILGELERVFRKLERDSIPFILLKGPHLAESVYKDWALRPFGDLDLLIRKEDSSVILSSLQEIGYHSEAEAVNKPHHHLPQLKKDGSIPIEVHLGINSSKVVPFEADYDSLWRRAESEEISGARVLVLSVEDLLLNLSLHVCQHKFKTPLLSIYDISETIQRFKQKIDWVELVSRAHLWSAHKALFIIFEITRDLLGTTLPEEVMMNLCSEDYDSQLLREAEARIFHPRGIVSLCMEDMMLERKFIEKSKLICRSLFSFETLAQKYHVKKNSKLIYLFSFFYLIDLIIRHICIRVKSRKKIALKSQLALRKWLST